MARFGILGLLMLAMTVNTGCATTESAQPGAAICALAAGGAAVFGCTFAVSPAWCAGQAIIPAMAAGYIACEALLTREAGEPETPDCAPATVEKDCEPKQDR